MNEILSNTLQAYPDLQLILGQRVIIYSTLVVKDFLDTVGLICFIGS